MKTFVGTVCLLLLACALTAAEWEKTLSPDKPGPITELRPFRAEFRFGWSDIEAARATVTARYEGDDILVEGTGATEGLARLLWQLDVTHNARTRRPAFLPVETRQIETYANRTIDIHMVGKPDGFWRRRETGNPEPARWKKIDLTPLRDLVGAMLLIRSQDLAPGQEFTTIVYPGDSPFLVTIKALPPTQISVAGAPRDALPLDLRIRRINLKKDRRLEDHTKFRNGRIWLSNDSDRFPLRAEVSIFIGYVFAELVSLKFENP